MRRTAFILMVVLAGVGAGVTWYWYASAAPQASFQTAIVKRGDLRATVSATGTIEPEEVVDVGAQVMGMIKELGRDPNDSSRFVDYRTAVEDGTILAQIDDSLYRARVDKAAADVEQYRAQVAQSQADLRRAEADVLQLQAKLNQAERDWNRAQKLGPARVISDLDYDIARANFEVSRANLSVGKAAVEQTQAARQKADKAVIAAEADLREAQKNLEYTTIRSPVKGVIVDRRVNVGQTVVSSLNAPSLFLIARDLKRLQVWASVNEADISRIRVAQEVSFTVDAYPDEVFHGTVFQIRLNATMTQNVVTYTVVVVTDNTDGRLLPYLTASLRFEIDHRANVLLVPNAALRWLPQPQQIAPDVRGAYLEEERAASAAGAPPGAGEKKRGDRGLVWVEEKGFVRPLEVHVGLTDGVLTEVSGDDLREGQHIVVGESSPEQAEATTSPFAPRMFGGRR